MTDKLEEIWSRQEEFMQELRKHDLIPEWPVDLRTKPGQRMIRETIMNLIEELIEASFTLKNKVHRLTDDRALDFDHYTEELGDALAFFVEVCILSGLSPNELHAEYCRKNAIVKKRLEEGY